MNTTSARTPSTPPPSFQPSARGAEPLCRREPDTGRRGDEFESALRRKAAAREQTGEEAQETPGPSPTLDGRGAGLFASPAKAPPSVDAGGLAATGPFAQASAPVSTTAAPPTTAEPPPALPAPQAALEAALNALPPPTSLGSPACDGASAWDVSVHQPLGVSLDMRALRDARNGPTQPTWTLTITARAHEAAMLARHAPRLNERLRARAVTHAHVRIQGQDEEAQ